MKSKPTAATSYIYVPIFQSICTSPTQNPVDKTPSQSKISCLRVIYCTADESNWNTFHWLLSLTKRKDIYRNYGSHTRNN